MLKVSVIIPTCKRDESLIGTLKSILNQTYFDYEIIIIDQNDVVSSNLANLINNNKEKIKHFNVDFQSGARGRNEGMKLARGEILIFCDDDIEAAKNFIESHYNNYSDPRIGGVAGRVTTDSDIPVSGGQKIGIIRKWDAKVISNFNSTVRAEVEHAWGCNMSFRKNLLIKAGGFDERLRGTQSFDDASACFAVRRLGYKIVFDPLAEVKHLFAPSGGCRDMSFAKKMYWFYHNYMIFHLRFMPRLLLPIFLAKKILGITSLSIRKKDFKVISLCVKGLIDGLRDYRQKT